MKTVLFALALFCSVTLHAAEKPVTVTENANAFTLDNGVLVARVAKGSGDLLSLKYQGLEMLDTISQRQPGYWSHNAALGEHITRITIDPQANGGQRAEVSIKGIGKGRQMGSGPGGSVVADIEIRYALARGDSGLYTYSILSHPTNYPGTSLGEARFCLKLNDDVFDWMTVDSNRNMQMITTYDWNHGTPMNMKEARYMSTGLYQGQVEHKYDYSANQFTVRTWGWQSTAKHVGLWFINPSVEYLSGGPTKYELSAHRDATFTTSLTAAAPPTLLNYWRSSHYGGAICNIAATDAWSKVVGPFLIYCNYGPTHDVVWKNALDREKIETAAWPFDWVNGVDYPHRNERATVSGKIVLWDPRAPGQTMSNLLVGLTAPDYTPATIPRGRGGFGGFGLGGGGEDDTNTVSTADNQARPNFTPRGGTGTNSFAGGTNRTGRARGGFGGGGGFGGFRGPRIVDWQSDARNYEFWVRGDNKGNFTIPNIRPGVYTLHAISDGVLGELAVSNITITAGKNLNLGTLNWEPVRYGKQLWDIGIPNRNASEFFGGDDYFHWGWYLKYPKLFPNDVHYTIGRSDFRKDWFFEQVPHGENAGNTNGLGRGRDTTWTIAFNLPQAPAGKATLRLAICGISTRDLSASVNDEPIGHATNLVYNATINRDGISGSWCERDLTFDASLMKAGANNLKLTIPGGGLANGIMYDYIRLELNDPKAIAKD
ncbi:MAG TPA: polysaccharide lyase family protein [Verrucomicrobiae bacterium]|nr:polysaccharide lyase family protein [Verrucomicrobiae bacterium]